MKYYVNDDLECKYAIYEDGTIINESTGRQISPTKDSRRPTEPPIVYFRKKDGKRIFRYYDDFMAEMFLPGYEKGCTVHHLDGDVTNCKLDNLCIANGIDALVNVFKDKGKWKKVNIKVLDNCPTDKLFYDYYICSDGRLFNGTTCSYLVPFVDPRDRNKGYVRYNLYYGKSSKEVIHVSAARLVAYHFLPIIENKDKVLYIDGNPQNVDVSNLYFGDAWDALCKDIQDNNREFNTLNYYGLGPEKWEKIDHLPNCKYELEDEYYVSSYGRVYNMTKKFYPVQQLSAALNANNQGYLSVRLCVTNYPGDHFIKYPVHRLVASKFCKNDKPKVYNTVNHINGNPECNLYNNLEWTTDFGNIHHAINTNLIHTDMFDERNDTAGWRTSTLLAWIFVMCDDDIDKSFDMYNAYLKTYDDNVSVLSKKEFYDYYSNNVNQQDSDFMKQYNFYKSERYVDNFEL